MQIVCKSMKAITAILLDTRRAKKDNHYPVKVRVTYNRKQKYYPTGIDLSPEDWELVNGDKPKKPYKRIKELLVGEQGKAKQVIDDLKVFSFDMFEARFYKRRTANGALQGLYEDYIQKLTDEGRIGTAKSYLCSINSLKGFAPNLGFEQVTPEFLERYEQWMLDKGNSATTVGIYLRPLRYIMNAAISNGLLPQELYPFGKRKYVIPAGTAVKKALSLADVKTIIDYTTPPGSGMERARDYWIFSYLCNGMNVKDMAKLQYKNIDGDFLRFNRTKTERSTKGNAKQVTVYLMPEAKDIINKWGNEHKPGNYIFPILKSEMTAEDAYHQVKHCTKTINKYMKQIADDLQLDKKITTYTARHTFSTVLKRSGASVEFIQEALGHTDKSTTEAYLDSFEEDTKKAYTRKLLEF